MSGNCRTLDKLEEEGIGAADARRSRPKTFLHAPVVSIGEPVASGA